MKLLSDDSPIDLYLESRNTTLLIKTKATFISLKCRKTVMLWNIITI